jgi:hypothetical protein
MGLRGKATITAVMILSRVELRAAITADKVGGTVTSSKLTPS